MTVDPGGNGDSERLISIIFILMCTCVIVILIFLFIKLKNKIVMFKKPNPSSTIQETYCVITILIDRMTQIFIIDMILSLTLSIILLCMMNKFLCTYYEADNLQNNCCLTKQGCPYSNELSLSSNDYKANSSKELFTVHTIWYVFRKIMMSFTTAMFCLIVQTQNFEWIVMIHFIKS